MDLTSDSTHIQRARVTTPWRTDARLRLEVALGTEDVHPPGLPAGAILVVRRLSLGGDRLARQVREALSDLLRGAARPVAGPVPHDAPAVLFASLGELLAVLAMLAARGEQPWWCALLDGVQRHPARFVEAWLDAAEHVPEALEHLERAGALLEVVSTLSETEARGVARRVAARYGLADVDAGLAEVALGVAPASLAAPAVEAAVEDVLASSAVLALRLRGRPATAALVILGGAIVRPPGQALSVVVLTAVRRLYVVESPGQTTITTANAHEASTEPAAAGALSVESQDDTPPARPAASPQVGDVAFAVASAIESPRPGPPHQAPSALPSIVPANSHILTLAEEQEAAPPSAPSTSADPKPAQRPARRIPFAFGTPELALVVPTDCGGTLYLLNVLLQIGVYADFSQPTASDPGISPWDLLVIATGRLGGELPEDLLWGVLADLAGRERDVPPPANWTPPDGWTAPADWLADEGVPWIDRVVREVRRLLDRVLPGPVTWLHQRGMVRVGLTRIDATFAIDTHPLEVRLSGLDRNPGWIPAAGRDVRFHYT